MNHKNKAHRRQSVGGADDIGGRLMSVSTCQYTTTRPRGQAPITEAQKFTLAGLAASIGRPLFSAYRSKYDIWEAISKMTRTQAHTLINAILSDRARQRQAREQAARLLAEIRGQDVN